MANEGIANSMRVAADFFEGGGIRKLARGEWPARIEMGFQQDGFSVRVTPSPVKDENSATSDDNRILGLR